MIWAQELFTNDTGKNSWKEVIEEYGPTIVPALRTYASLLKKEVKVSDLKKKSIRPASYLTWLKKITSRVSK